MEIGQLVEICLPYFGAEKVRKLTIGRIRFRLETGHYAVECQNITDKKLRFFKEESLRKLTPLEALARAND